MSITVSNPGKSAKTRLVTIRIPVEVYDVIKQRIEGRRGRWESVNAWIQERVIYDVMRPHTKGKTFDWAKFFGGVCPEGHVMIPAGQGYFCPICRKRYPKKINNPVGEIRCSRCGRKITTKRMYVNPKTKTIYCLDCGS